ncbi:MAG: hypothetical protein RIM23_26055 [Coleofasciculus sp. G3-WIS-01]|uniref:hypothetical protein n=1 Tax=Coleofasciculus sp. G3-WIS-01 TaxID=3069528 RepID=UPI003300174A
MIEQKSRNSPPVYTVGMNKEEPGDYSLVAILGLGLNWLIVPALERVRRLLQV